MAPAQITIHFMDLLRPRDCMYSTCITLLGPGIEEPYGYAPGKHFTGRLKASAGSCCRFPCGGTRETRAVGRGWNIIWERSKKRRARTRRYCSDIPCPIALLAPRLHDGCRWMGTNWIASQKLVFRVFTQTGDSRCHDGLAFERWPDPDPDPYPMLWPTQCSVEMCVLLLLYAALPCWIERGNCEVQKVMRWRQI